MNAAPALPPPVIEQPAAHQVSFGLVTGIAPSGTRRVRVSVGSRTLADGPLRGRRFTLHVRLPLGDVSVRVVTVGRGGKRSSRVVPSVYGLPSASAPRIVRARHDVALTQKLRRLLQQYDGVAGAFVQNLTEGGGAAWNAKARFPAASTLKIAIATAVLADYPGIPPPGSSVDALLQDMIIPSGDAAANALLVWIGGSTSGGSYRVDGLMRSLGMRDSLMYGGYEVTRLSDGIPVRVEEQPAFGVGKYTTAWDMASLHRAVWLAAGNKGPLRRAEPGFTAADGRYLLWLLAHVRDTPKLDRYIGSRHDVAVLHKAGWISAVRHDTGLVFWPGGVFVASVMTWRGSGVGASSDVLAGRCAEVALARFRNRPG